MQVSSVGVGPTPRTKALSGSVYSASFPAVIVLESLKDAYSVVPRAYPIVPTATYLAALLGMIETIDLFVGYQCTLIFISVFY